MDRPPAQNTTTTALVPDPELGESVVARLWRVFRGEPMLLVTFGYLFVSVIGLWDSYWYYRRFDLPILEFMHSSDYFVAGLRRPAYASMLLFVIAISAFALWPERWRQRHPERAIELQRRWWGRLLVPRRTDWWMYFGLHPVTTVTLLGVLMMGMMLHADSVNRAEQIQRGGGTAVRVQLAGDAAPLPGDWRLLGTSSAFVYMWDASARRAEALPLDAITRIVPLGAMPVRRQNAERSPSTGPAAP